MSHDDGIERYVQDPALLVVLCRDVGKALQEASQSLEQAAMEKQLREIAKTISRLEKQAIPVPDGLRSEKIRLAAALPVGSGSPGRHLRYLADALGALVHEMQVQTGQKKVRRTRRRASRIGKGGQKLPSTKPEVLRPMIIEALHHHGGSAAVGDVMQYIDKKMAGSFLPGDLERRQSGQYVWQNNVEWERLRMREAGLLKDDSRRGIWELA
jgi:hypothetical protein